MLKNIIFYFSKVILNKNLDVLNGIILFLLSRTSSRVFRIVVSAIDFDKLSKIKFGLFVKHKIRPLDEFNSSIYKILDDSRYEDIRTPDIYDLTKDNYIRLKRRRIAVYKFNNVTITPDSDILIFKNYVFWEKMLRPESAMTIPLDVNYVSVNLDKTEVLLLKENTKPLKYKTGYSLLGVHTKAWAHFVITYIPKLLASRNIKTQDVLNLFVSSNMHENHIDLINFVLKNCIPEISCNIVLVKDGESIICDELYYCNTTAYFCDHSKYIHPSSACISEYSAKAVKEVSASLWKTVKVSSQKKLYIGRGKGRNLFNAVEVENYFCDNGFEIVYPHLLTFEEKIQVFGNASHICGPVSSGFANLIFCKSNIKILGFFNYARVFDPFISALCHSGNFNHKIMFITGEEQVNSNLNNSYYIQLERIKDCCNQIDFLN